MRVENLNEGSRIYTSNSYFISGDWNTPDDVITLIDPGRDPEIMTFLLERKRQTGKAVDLVLLTHAHYDHCALVPQIIRNFSPTVLCADIESISGSRSLHHGEILKVGDVSCEVFATPGHSDDSVSFYCEETGALFVGDAPLFDPADMDDDPRRRLLSSIEDLSLREVKTLWFGHGDPMVSGCREFLSQVIRQLQPDGAVDSGVV